ARGCDAVLTGGAMQSNHCRQTAAAAAACGLECHLALGGEPPETPEGNLLLDLLFGAAIHWCGEQRKGERLPGLAAELRGAGRRPYLIPYGGSNAVGALGFVAAVEELRGQLPALDGRVDAIVFPSSSGGTHAGTTVGVDALGLGARVVGIGIDRREPHEAPYEQELAGLANEVAAKLGLGQRYAARDFVVRQEFLGQGYGVLGDREREAIRLAARLEGILVDPVYTGRALGGLIEMVRGGEFGADDTVLFWHTGGAPALFAYGRELLPG
ncbi:MAG: D-cysteine desulfhydrase family protein, partial [Proteobacteria bacterium]|nr:D-cysteine desulfhydrase family protein [Pseudomonadota bacterium]